MQLIKSLMKWIKGRPAKPTRPPTCPVCQGRGVIRWHAFCSSSCGKFHEYWRACVACGGATAVPRKVIAGLPDGPAIEAAVAYGRNFRNN